MRSSFAVLVLLVAAGGAVADDAFEKTVRPLLVGQCQRCHGPDKQKGGLRVDSREALLSGGDSGPAVVPGKPDDSLLVRAVRHQDLEMPPAGKLADAQVQALAQWVQDGAAWGGPAAGAAPNKLAARRPGQITDADRNWWAFRPVVRPAVPAAGDGWAVNAVDRFVAAGFAAGQTPAAEADRLTLLRRLTFDLLGLPPTPEEAAAFAADTSADAYAKLVDRLLASPRYGERQARAWLDLVRYADSDGYRVDFSRPHAWKYRDYVVRSFNADKGFDRFVREQLAGDELHPGDPDALVATGYLRLGPYEYNQRDVRGQWAAINNDVADTTADALLGLGMGCARCHDHKFDPILQKDYFALQAFFAGVHFVDEPVFASAAAKADYEARRAAWEAKTAGVRAKIDALLAPVRAKEMAGAAAKFTADVRAIFAKAPADRTPGEQQLYELAYRQVDYEHERAPSKLKGQAKAEYDRLAKELAALSAGEPASPLAPVARDLGPRAADVFVPGSRKAPVRVEPAFPTVLGGPPPAVAPTAASTGRRSALALWLTRPDHPLTARVLVNRLWQGHFGAGLVGTASDFGTLGDKPTHPELLDWLAAEFTGHGWSLKHVHRLIVTSATYKMRSADFGSRIESKADRGGSRSVSSDPKSEIHTPQSFHRVRRLDAEQVRDAMLAVSGELKPDAGGPAVGPDKPRRSVYTKLMRNTPDALLASFDAADGLASCPRRNVTVTPTQALLLLNGSGTLARAAAFAARVMPAEGKDAPAGVDRAYRLAFGRPPTPAEAAGALTFLRQQVGVAAGRAVTPAGRQAAWADFCHALLNANEFLYVD